MQKEHLISQGKMKEDTILQLLGVSGTVYEKSVNLENGHQSIFIYEEYYFELESSISVTLIYEEGKESSDVYIIVAGGNDGYNSIEQGQERNTIKQIVKKFSQFGYYVSE